MITMYARLGFVLLIIAKIHCLAIRTNEDKTLVSDYIAMEEALIVAKASNSALNSHVRASHNNYTTELEPMLDDILADVTALVGSVTDLEAEVETFHRDVHAKFNNLTNEGLSLQRLLLKIENDLGDWINLTEDIDKYEKIWAYLPGLYVSHKEATMQAYSDLANHIKESIANEEPEDQASILSKLSNLKFKLAIEIPKINLVLDTASSDATLFISATKQYLTNFS